MKTFRYIDGVATLRLDLERCIGCGMCVTVCPQAVFVCDNRKALIIDGDGCMECGACSSNCPVAAISVNPGVGCAALIVSRWLQRVGIRSTGCC